MKMHADTPANHASCMLLSFSDSHNVSGKVPASTIFDTLTKKHVWYVIRRPAKLVAGTNVLFYQSAVGIRGYATLVQIVENNASDMSWMRNLGLYQLRFRLDIADVVKFETPVPLGPMVNELEFVANKKFWGHSVRGTPRIISLTDFNRIVSASKKII